MAQRTGPAAPHYTIPGGLGRLSGDAQGEAIRSMYFPDPSREEEALVRLLLAGATSGRDAAEAPDSAELRGMEEAGHVKRRGGRFYLTEVGAYVAEGALSIYPELGRLARGPARRRWPKARPAAAA